MLALLGLVLAQNPSVVTTTGYADTRTTAANTLFDGAPGLTELVEGNVQLKVTPHERVTLYADTSLFWQGAWFVHGGDRDLTNYRPTAVLSELYADVTPKDGLRFLVGKKRIVWGSGLSFNPTDVLNPPKDPTDPTFQRAGAWLAQAEYGTERFAFTLVGAGKVTRQYAGLPTGLVWYPPNQTSESVRGWVGDDRDGQAHYSLAGRVYLLLADTDLNFIYSFSNLYNDAFTNKSRLGVSASRVFGALEVHVEAIGYTGSSRIEANPDCVDAPLLCLGQGITIASRPLLDSRWLNGRALVGARYQFADNGFLSAEYYLNGEGHDPAGFRRLATLAKANPLLAQQAIAGTTDPGTPQKFSFEPLRRHYLVMQYSKPQLFDDWTVSASALVGLEDLSMQLVPQVQWAPKEWLQLTLATYVPLSGVAAWGVQVGESSYGEFTLGAVGTRVMLQARIFY